MHPLATSTAAAALATLLALGARAEPLTVYIGYTSLGIVNTTDEQKECLETTPPVRTETRNVTDTDERTPGACRTRACTESRDIADCPDGTDDIVGAWIQNACSDWTDIECEAPPIECPTPESNVRNHDCPGQTVLKQLRIRQPVIEGDTCVLGEWTEWNPPCSSTDVCPTPETDTRACAGDPSAEQTQARTSSEVNGACTWGAWSQWTPECPREQCRDGTTVATGETCPLFCSDPYGAIGAQIEHACGECTWSEPTPNRPGHYTCERTWRECTEAKVTGQWVARSALVRGLGEVPQECQGPPNPCALNPDATECQPTDGQCKNETLTWQDQHTSLACSATMSTTVENGFEACLSDSSDISQGTIRAVCRAGTLVPITWACHAYCDATTPGARNDLGDVPRTRNAQHYCTGRRAIYIPCPDGTPGCSYLTGLNTEHTCTVDAFGKAQWNSVDTGSKYCGLPDFLGIPTDSVDWDGYGIAPSNKCFLTPQRRTVERHKACDGSRLSTGSYKAPDKQQEERPVKECVEAGCTAEFPQHNCRAARQ